ncbi:MAG: recombination regulator RecX [Treponema sp.]|nr:recombination regulator RecX [Treponema sp.]
MTVKTLVESSYSGMFKFTPEEGSSFYIRKEYLPEGLFDKIDIGVEFDEEQADSLMDAGLTCAVELKAVAYLARAEQSRFGLTRKLIEKKFDKKYVEAALTYLEVRGYLSDRRYATAWLNTRRINHYEGRTRLAAELASRGIEREVANEALDEFFTEHDEAEICLKAYEKLSKKKSGDKLTAALIQSGFSYKQINEMYSTL